MTKRLWVTLLSLMLASGCATDASQRLLGRPACPSGTTETVELREPNFADHRCEDASGLAQGTAWTTADGKLRELGAYLDGEPHGVAKVWGETGKLWAEIEYETGNPVRLQRWHDNGQRAEEWRYEDPKTAEVWKWDEEGNLTDRLSWRNGDIEGLWTKYWSDGSPKRQAEWRAGKLDGAFTEWHETGSLSARGRYAAGLKVGEWRFWNEDGTQSVRVY